MSKARDLARLNGPAFNAFLNTSQSVTTSTMTKIQMNAEAFDTANNFDVAAYKFTPNVPGYYQVSFQAIFGGSNLTNVQAFIFKNGSNISTPYVYAPSISSLTNYSMTQSKLIYMNGTTDYLEFYVYVSGGSPAIVGDGSNSYTYATGFLARAA